MKAVDANLAMLQIGKEMKYAAGRYRAGLRKAWEIIKGLPEASPPTISLYEDNQTSGTGTELHSHWFVESNWWFCDHCGGRSQGSRTTPYCPHCGARMDEETEIE